MRLVVLNSCWSGAVPPEETENPFAGVAVSLLRRGVPATVAMQFPISDRAAIRFSEGFYKSLVTGAPVEEAVTEGRLAILADHGESLEWVTPVLFLPGDGQLFQLPKQAAAGRKTEERQRKPRAAAAERPLHLSVWSFAKPFVCVEKPDALLDLREFFDDRVILEHRLWAEEVFPRLRDFLRSHAVPKRPIFLDFAAHSSLAFAAGYVLEAKSGLDIGMYQKAQVGAPRLLRAEAGPARQGPLWLDEREIAIDEQSRDVAMAVGVTWPVVEDVMGYLKSAEETRVGRVVPRTLFPQPNPAGMEDGLHALQLAHDLAYRIRLRAPEERGATLHLFASVPNILLFLLGQLGKAFGAIQLYEHDFGNTNKYIPSLRLPVPARAGEPGAS